MYKGKIINKDFINDFRIKMSGVIRLTDDKSNEETEIVPKKLKHSYLLNYFKINDDIIKFYHLPTSNILTTNEYEKMVESKYFTVKSALYPFPFKIYNAYHSRADLIIKLNQVINESKEIKLNGNEINHFYDLEPYFKEYAKGFKNGFNEFDNIHIKPFLTLLATQQDYVKKVFDYLTQKFLSEYVWTSKRGFSKNRRNKSNEIIFMFENGQRQGCFYKAWSIVFSNNDLFAPLFQEYFKTSTIQLKETKKPKLSENSLHQKIEDTFKFMQFDDDRKHEVILNETDYGNLIEWVLFYFENNFKLPEIKNPIKIINTSKGNVIYTFKLIFKELHPSKTRPDSLFELIKLCFYEYRDDNINNFKKQKEPQYYNDTISNY